MMIPLRRALIVKEHGILKYPEGTRVRRRAQGRRERRGSRRSLRLPRRRKSDKRQNMLDR